MLEIKIFLSYTWKSVNYKHKLVCGARFIFYKLKILETQPQIATELSVYSH